MTDPTREQMLERIAELEKDNVVLRRSAARANEIAQRSGDYAIAVGQYRDDAWKRRDQLLAQVQVLHDRIAKVRFMAINANDGCAYCADEKLVDARELLAVLDGCGRDGCAEQRPHEHITLPARDCPEDEVYNEGKGNG